MGLQKKKAPVKAPLLAVGLFRFAELVLPHISEMKSFERACSAAKWIVEGAGERYDGPEIEPIRKSRLGGIQYERQPPVSEALLVGARRRFHLRHIRGPSRFVCRHRPPIRFEHCGNRGHWSRYPSGDVDGDVPAKTLPAG